MPYSLSLTSFWNLAQGPTTDQPGSDFTLATSYDPRLNDTRIIFPTPDQTLDDIAGGSDTPPGPTSDHQYENSAGQPISLDEVQTATVIQAGVTYENVRILIGPKTDADWSVTGGGDVSALNAAGFQILAVWAELTPGNWQIIGYTSKSMSIEDATRLVPGADASSSLDADDGLAATAFQQASNGIVEGTDDDDSIDENYTGDPEGDMVDGGNTPPPHGPYDDVIYGFGGNDTIHGGDGNDTIDGGDGNDIIFGGRDDDSILGGMGDDSIYGEEGNDYIDGGLGSDTIDGGDGNDIILGGDGPDSLIGGLGNDVIIAGSGNDTIDGGDGNDTIYGEEGDDTIYGGDGNDFINAEKGNDFVEGGAGDDFILGGEDNDTIDGGDGEDLIFGDEGDDSIFGGAGNDILQGGLGNDTIYGGEDDDYLFGEDGDDSLIGGAGNDTIYGGDGNDFIDAGKGNDFVEGGSGNDSIYADYNDAGNATLYGGEGDDFLQGGDGDHLYGEAGNDTLINVRGNATLDGGEGNDSLIVYGGNATLTGGDGFDRFSFVDLSGDLGSVLITDFNTGTGQDIHDGDQSNNDLVDLREYYNQTNLDAYNAAHGTNYKNPLQWMRADQADDGTLNMLDGQNGLPFLNLRIENDGSPVAPEDLTYDNTSIVCFTNGTLIETGQGQQRIDDLRPGDLVHTADNGLQPIRWIGSVRLDARTLAANPKLRPIRIRAGALGKGTPSSDLVVSPQHRVLVRSKIAQKMFGTEEVLVAARQLVQIEGIDIASDITEVGYFHMLFDRHEVVTSNGALTESLYTGPQALQSVGKAALEEIFTLFPQLREEGSEPTPARPLTSGRRARKLANRHLQHHRAMVC
ncbi:hypothetical protein F8A10_11500 [Paracoccus kondratievae]|uniref:Hint domain-containing protein n=1 Tax=Paracoccus kondratievae TaxID=135740 RepID=UPI0012667428|nr:Hint domain-containing protein [Paracoccus kondratievae]QFQ88138.1 hypothetical protein F8A10_11500 [Paracoccus kondratievae]